MARIELNFLAKRKQADIFGPKGMYYLGRLQLKKVQVVGDRYIAHLIVNHQIVRLTLIKSKGQFKFLYFIRENEVEKEERIFFLSVIESCKDAQIALDEFKWIQDFINHEIRVKRRNSILQNNIKKQIYRKILNELEREFG